MKEALVIIHGWRSSSLSFVDVLKYLSKNIEPILFDLPGFGKTPLERAYSLEDYLIFLEKNLEKEISLRKLESFYLLGHSFGGALALLYTLYHPEKIKSLILYNPALIREKSLKVLVFTFFIKFLKPLQKLIPKNILFIFKKAFYRFIIGSYDYFLVNDVLKETFKKIQRDLREEAKKVTNKTYLLWGKDDKITPLKHGYLLQKIMPNAELIILEGGHSLHKEKPQVFAEIINQIIERNVNR